MEDLFHLFLLNCVIFHFWKFRGRLLLFVYLGFMYKYDIHIYIYVIVIGGAH